MKRRSAAVLGTIFIIHGIPDSPEYHTALFVWTPQETPTQNTLLGQSMLIQKMFDLSTWEQLYDLLAKPRRAIPVPNT
ncbi:MAG: hypothetical protein F4039_08750 [Gammaproteobacteria bacterium]|nr:hypothetical protein [Gammaproteobacteria bacterium]